jgi:predicted RNA-binding protein with EMAP domain
VKPKDFLEYKAERNGEVTPRSVIDNLSEAIDRGEVDEVVFVVRCKDGEVKCGYSHSNHLAQLGLLTVGKDMIIRDMEGYE